MHFGRFAAGRVYIKQILPQQPARFHGQQHRKEGYQTLSEFPKGRHRCHLLHRKRDFQSCSRCRASQSGVFASTPAVPSKIEAECPDFELVKIPGNGSCMFQALAQGHHYLSHGKLLNERELAREGFAVRRSICYMLDKHREEVEPFIAGDFRSYISHMAMEGIWGGEPELAMAVKSLERPILVYTTRSKSGLFGLSLTKASEYGTDCYTDVPPICLLFTNSHYDTLLAKA